MLGNVERGALQTVCEVKPHEGGHRGRLSIPGWGTKYTAVYPDKTDAVAALVDLRHEAYGSNVVQEALPEIDTSATCAVRTAYATGIADHTYAVAV